MDIVLVHPEIPGNTGNIGRTCVATRTPLHLIEPLGFSLDDRFLKRAGLDYWQHLDVKVHPSLTKCLQTDKLKGRPIFLFSRFSKKPIWKTKFPSDSILIFGSETEGLSPSVKKKNSSRLIQIPMKGPTRSLNLSTAVGIALYEALDKTKNSCFLFLP